MTGNQAFLLNASSFQKTCHNLNLALGMIYHQRRCHHRKMAEVVVEVMMMMKTLEAERAIMLIKQATKMMGKIPVETMAGIRWQVGKITHMMVTPQVIQAMMVTLIRILALSVIVFQIILRNMAQLYLIVTQLLRSPNKSNTCAQSTAKTTTIAMT